MKRKLSSLTRRPLSALLALLMVASLFTVCAVSVSADETDPFATGVTVNTNSNDEDAAYIVHNTAHAADPYRWTDGTDHYVVWKFNIPKGTELVVAATVLMNYVVSVSPDNETWTEAANWGWISGGERITDQSNETTVYLSSSDYGCTDTMYVKLSNMDNAGDYGGAIKKLSIRSFAKTEGDPFADGLIIATTNQGADSPYIIENNGFECDAYRWTDGTDHHIIYCFDIAEGTILNVKATVFMNYEVSVSPDNQDWIVAASWGDISGGERFEGQDNVNVVDIVSSDYGCTSKIYVKIGNMGNDGGWGGGIKQFAIKTLPASGDEFATGKTLSVPSGQDTFYIVENKAHYFDGAPWRWTDGTDHHVIYKFNIPEGKKLSVTATVAMNYVLSVSGDNVNWIEAANYGDISGGTRIQNSDNKTDITMVSSDYDCTEVMYVKLSNVDNAGDCGGAVLQLHIKSDYLVPENVPVDVTGLTAYPVKSYTGNDIAVLAKENGVSGYTKETIVGVDHQAGGQLYEGLTTPYVETVYDFTALERVNTNSKNEDEQYIVENYALAADPYRWTDGTDRHIIYGFDANEIGAVQVNVLMNYVVSISSDNVNWIKVASWGDISGGVRTTSQAESRTSIDVVFANYGCTDNAYVKISNLGNAGDYGGAIESFTTMMAIPKDSYLVNTSDTLRLEADVKLNNESEELTLSLTNGEYGTSATCTDYTSLEKLTNASYMEEIEYRTVSLSYQVPSEAAEALKTAGFDVGITGPQSGCTVYGIRVINETTGETLMTLSPSDLEQAARSDSNPQAVSLVKKSWSNVDKVIGIRDCYGPHASTVFGPIIPVNGPDGEADYAEGDLIMVIIHAYYDCDEDSLPESGACLRAEITEPDNPEVKHMDSNAIDLYEYFEAQDTPEDLYDGNAWKEFTFTFTVPSADSSKIPTQGIRFEIGSWLGNFAEFPLCLYSVEFYNASTDETFYTMEGADWLNTPLQDGQKIERIVSSGEFSGVIAEAIVGNDASTLLSSDKTTLSAGKYAYDFDCIAGSNAVNAALVTVYGNNDQPLNSTVIRVNKEHQPFTQRLLFELAEESEVYFKVTYLNETRLTLTQVTLNEMISESEVALRTVIDQIDALPTVDELTLKNKAAVSAAQKAYNALDEESKAAVTNAEKLTQAVAKIDELEKQVEADKAAAKAVDDAILALPTVEELAKADKTAVEAARAAYADLTETQQGLVTELSALETVEARMALLNAATDDEIAAAKAVDEQIAALPAVKDLVYADGEKVAEVRAAYDALSEKAAALVLNLDTLIEVEKKIATLTPDYTLGDINGDDAINASDALLALQHSVKLTTLEGADYDAANVDGSNAVDATDALYILQYSVKLIDKFPIEK